jgi:alkylation response protein AidB-like acyl-CoA dehydrogenase
VPIGIGDEHVELAGSLHKWAEAAGAVEAVRAAEEDPAVLAGWGPRWAELGLAAVALPEPTGGGGTLLDQAVMLEAAASSLVPGPLLATVLGGLLADDADLRAGIADGSITVALGLGDGLATAADRLAGEVATVLDAPSATHLLLPTDDGDWALLPVALADIAAGRSPDLSRTVGSVRVDVPLADVRRVRVADSPQRLLLTLAAAEASGVARWCLDTAVAYAGVREQFGRKIGGFQAVKHLCAQMLETSESVTAAAWDAAVAGPGAQG